MVLQTWQSNLRLYVPVISVPDQVADRLEPSDDSSGPSYIDYSERRSLPISIPDYQAVSQNGEKFVVSGTFLRSIEIELKIDIFFNFFIWIWHLIRFCLFVVYKHHLVSGF